MRRLLARELIRAGLHTYVLSALTLAANLVSGVVTARALAPTGRGEAVAIATLAQTLGFAFALGCAHAISYAYAREPSSGGRLLTAWTVFLVPFGALAVLVGEVALPALFHAQSAGATALARVYLLTIALVLWSELVNGLLLGAGEYLFVNVVRFAQPAVVAVVQVVLWRVGALTVETSLISAAGSSAIVQTIAMRRVLRATGGFARLDRPLARETLWYGFRGQGVLLAGALNQRLDLVIMPAFLGAASVGLYSIAANVSLIVSTLANSFALLVLPAAVRGGERGPATVVRSLQGVLLVAVVSAGVLVVLARPALSLVYGSAFANAASALRILLPGTALLAGASVLISGLYAANRPGLATITQLTGLVVTVVGLLVFLPSHGILAAAIVSTAAYATVFVCALLTYRRTVALPWRRLMKG